MKNITEKTDKEIRSEINAIKTHFDVFMAAMKDGKVHSDKLENYEHELYDKMLRFLLSGTEYASYTNIIDNLDSYYYGF